MRSYGVMTERGEDKTDPGFEAAAALMKNGCSQGENIGGIFSTIITPDPTRKIIVSIKDAGDARSFDKLFCGKAAYHQKNLVLTAIKNVLSATHVHDGGVIVVQVDRSSDLLEITMFGLSTSSADAIRGQLSHNYGFSIFEDCGHQSMLKISVPRKWNC